VTPVSFSPPASPIQENRTHLKNFKNFIGTLEKELDGSIFLVKGSPPTRSFEIYLFITILK
jgi:hypothetical protein